MLCPRPGMRHNADLFPVQAPYFRAVDRMNEQLTFKARDAVQGSSAGAITLGILLTLASQIFQAVRLVMEESMLKKMELHPMEVSLLVICASYNLLWTMFAEFGDLIPHSCQDWSSGILHAVGAAVLGLHPRPWQSVCALVC